MLLFDLGNAVGTDGHPVAQHAPSTPTYDEFVGMNEYVMESFHDLLAGEPESPSGSDSSRGVITPLMSVSWQVPLRDTSKASMKRRLPRQTTLTMR